MNVILVILWVIGVVLAKGFFSTLCAFIFPFWAWYLVAEKALTYWGFI